ncbi:proto-oncogene tyrosine-protein kinase ROS isoform X2 [Rhinatrema bivittatum]|uniref:proto-oncogene tyrosine-protein kinase ROS isoform X2 n=1 Tax=Rhinatrema bivittatum TaxID=194408 RepID=UPI00112B8FFB|nr:proto-oncogene tyrosine-protein kinase ROS isoform X2 [Rhinatrema bivittatum]
MSSEWGGFWGGVLCNVSSLSRPYKMKPRGAPSSAPEVVRIESPSPLSVFLSWLPPTFPNGPLTGYVLHLWNADEALTREVSVEEQNYTIFFTTPGTAYRCSVAARNSEGVGPMAIVNITTQPKPELSTDPILWLSQQNYLYRSEPGTMEEMMCVDAFWIKDCITGMTADLREGLLYIAEGSRIWAFSPVNITTPRLIHHGDSPVRGLALDWLYKKLYFVVEPEIHQCALPHCSERVGVTVHFQPSKIIVDPLNGFVFLGSPHGIYRATLGSDLNSTELVVRGSTALAFFVDPAVKRLFYVPGNAGELCSVFLDGSGLQVDDRLRKVPAAVRSAAYAGGVLSVSTGQQVFTEETYEGGSTLIEVSVQFCERTLGSFSNLLLWELSSQPLPVPLLPPAEVQVLLGASSALVTWGKPLLGYGLGPRAWQEWLYDLLVVDSHGKVLHEGISTTHYRVTNLSSCAAYAFKVRATSRGGKGPWSAEVQGSTIKSDDHPYLLMGSGSGIWNVSLERFHGALLFSSSEAVFALDYIDNGTLCWANSAGEAYIGFLSDLNSQMRPIKGVQRAHILAFDWIGGMLYWADTKVNRILRMPLDADVPQGVIGVSGRITDLELDPLAGYIYWTTAHTLECARLNGAQLKVLVEIPTFASKQIKGLSVNLEDTMLYWMVQESSRTEIYQAELCKNRYCKTSSSFKIFSVDSVEASYHELQYYSARLAWISETDSIHSVELGRSQSVVVATGTNIITFTVVKPRPLPAGFVTKPEVMPHPLAEFSFVITGNSSEFCINWEKPANVNYGTVFYLFKSNALSVVKDLDTHTYCVSGLHPFSEFDIKVQPHTYWRSAAETQLILRSPEAVPSVPENPRTFARLLSDVLLEIEFRWDRPRYTNGVLQGYKVFYAEENCSQEAVDIQGGSTAVLPGNATSYTLAKAELGRIYCFQVAGFTGAGTGLRTTVKVERGQESEPVPYAWVVGDGQVSLLDVDTQRVLQTLSLASVIGTAYIKLLKLVYCLTDTFILSAPIDSSKKLQLLYSTMPGPPKALAADWIGHKLYVVIRGDEKGNSSIYWLDIQERARRLRKLVSVGEELLSLGLYPQESFLFWTQQSSVSPTLVSYDLIEKRIKILVEVQPHHHVLILQTRDCNCSSAYLRLEGPLTVDATDLRHGTLYLITQDQELWASDLNGCQCWRLGNFTGHGGYKITSLSVDSRALYWINQTKTRTVLFRADKLSGRIVTQIQLSGDISSATVYSGDSQPYPAPKCLMPRPYTQQVEVMSKTESTLLLHIPPLEFPRECARISRPSLTYTVHYGELQDRASNVTCSSGLQCFRQETQENEVELKGLRSYTRYLVQVSVSSFYKDWSNKLGSPTVNWTYFGVPSAPLLVTADVLSDSGIIVSWADPLEPNGPVEDLRYQVEMNGNYYWPGVPVRVQSEKERRSFNLGDLQSEKEYALRVLSFPPVGGSFSESAKVSATTFSRPTPPVILSVSNETASIWWTPPEDGSVKRYWFELSQDQSGLMKEVNCSTWENISCLIEGLQPSRTYTLRTSIIYRTNASSRSSKLAFKTAAGVPGKPGEPFLQGDVISWSAAEDHGLAIAFYTLQSRNSQNDTGLMSSGSNIWVTVHRGPCNTSVCSWRNHGLHGTYQFQVLAVNSLGAGELSDISRHFILTRSDLHENLLLLVLGPLCAVLLASGLCMAGAIYGWKQRKAKEMEEHSTGHMTSNPEVELAQIRGMAAAVIQTNVWYSSSYLPTQLELESLPVFPRGRLTLMSFLGSGAFGEVFEGVAKDILGADTGDMRVAVKTLRKGATDLEKSEFLKEAHLMSQFDHPHLLKLLGVCLQEEPQFLLLELMEGRDLLSFLRGARGTPLRAPLLSIADLIDICLDVAKGCTYLEKMRFVHRDLAARNCLVSVKDYKDSTHRKVKIGDFGLARDIYKSDYYKKEGEGLLPVRWMAPESLMDGLFTNQSDVWHQLMLKCWTCEPHMRPSFWCIDNCLEHLKKSCRESFQAVGYYNEGYRDGDISQGIVNQAFEERETPLESAEESQRANLVLLPVTDEGKSLHYVVYGNPSCMAQSSFPDAPKQVYGSNREGAVFGSCTSQKHFIKAPHNDAMKESVTSCLASATAQQNNSRYDLHKSPRSLSARSQQTDTQQKACKRRSNGVNFQGLSYAAMDWRDKTHTEDKAEKGQEKCQTQRPELQ